METIKRFITFVKESWHEVRHQVTYPTREEVRGTSIVVVVVTAAFSLYFSLVDVVMAELVTRFFALFA